MGHVGLTPQSVHDFGGFKIQGRSASEARTILEDALALEEAGVFSVVLEGIPAELAEMITERLQIPTLGIGAGPACDGQVLVLNDLIGLTEGHVPSFVRQYADVLTTLRGACRQFVGDVREGRFPADAESHHLKPEVLEEVRERLNHPASRHWKF